MGTFLLAFAVAGAVILALHIALCAGIISNMAAENAANAHSGPPARNRAQARAEVVVAVRDEAATLPLLLDSLRAQTRPDVLFLFVEDRSGDATSAVLDEFCAAVGNRARVIHNTREPIGLSGKQAALDLAFSRAKGDVLLFTDGDCVVPPTWADEMLAHFRDPRVGVVLGRIELAEEAGFLPRFQAFEQPLLNQYNLGSAGIGMPTGCFGNNMAVRAQAVKEIGGFHALGYSATEDAMLLNAVSRKGGWEVRTCTSDRGAAGTRAKQSWKGFIDQHTRWNAGGLFSPDLLTRVSFTLVVLIYLVGSIVVLPLGFLDWRVPILSLNSFLSIGLLAGLGGLYPGKNRARYYLRFFPYLFFFGFFYSYITVRALVRRRFDWKGTTLRP
ncbi:MAG: glycosyltransferase [Spirochaetia bacterium]|jgi:cellulose synthase/poly-beta-1,6-N-acetylglucosamine synthase-like glycosyltransferase